MGAFSIWHWIIVLIIVLLLFGKGKIPTLMGDMAKGIKSFKKNMSDEESSSTADSDKESSNKVLNRKQKAPFDVTKKATPKKNENPFSLLR